MDEPTFEIVTFERPVPLMRFTWFARILLDGQEVSLTGPHSDQHWARQVGKGKVAQLRSQIERDHMPPPAANTGQDWASL